MVLPASPPLAAAATAAGRQRARNGDASGLFPHLGLFAVTGGLGARGAGEVMSALAIEALREHFEAPHGGASRLADGIHLAHRRLVERARSDRGLEGASSSIAALSLGPEGLQVSHVGDSRVYRVVGGHLEQLTQDHTLINEAPRLMPGLGLEQLAQLPPKVLTRNLGLKEALDFEVQGFPLRPGELYLLCTRGLHAFVPPDELLDTLRAAPDLETAARALVDRALQREATDNITCMLVRPVVE